MRSWLSAAVLIGGVCLAGSCQGPEIDLCNGDPTCAGWGGSSPNATNSSASVAGATCCLGGAPSAATSTWLGGAATTVATDAVAGASASATGSFPSSAGGSTSHPCNGPCLGSAPICYLPTQRCVACLEDDDCAVGTVCKLDEHRCVACTEDRHCSGATPACDPSSNTCVGCTSNQYCSGSTPACAPSSHRCVGCLNDEACPTATPACLLAAHTCVPCTSDGYCSGATPACDPSTNRCVGCTASRHCSGAKPVCDAGPHQCVECLEHDDCKDPTKRVCQTGRKACVECAVDSDCASTVGRPICDGSQALCVGCLKNSDCKDASKPQCHPTAKLCVACLSNADCGADTASRCDGPTNTCGACQSNSDCAHIDAKAICLAGAAGQGSRCVRCTSSDESACVVKGTAYSCNPKTHDCTETPTASRKTCESCVADSECGTNEGKPDPNSRCVPMSFQGAAYGEAGYCLQTAASAGTSGCPAPFTVPQTAASLSGAASQTYCGINQQVTTCEALLDLFGSKSCEADADCGAGRGGLCRTVGTNPHRCTIACSETTECTSTRTCSGAANGYCR